MRFTTANSKASQNTQATVFSSDAFERVRLQNEYLSVDFLPELGGKMISLKRLESGREFLLQPPKRAYCRPKYGAKFEDYDTSGFDECFPSVSRCEYPEGKYLGTEVPDHGELWSVAWQYETREGELLLAASGRRFPYEFRKRVRLERSAIILSYEVENTSGESFSFIWSAHPLLAVSPGCRVTLPNEVNEVFINWSQGGRLGNFAGTCGWPMARETSGAKVNLAELGPARANTADKLFTPRLRQGYCAVYYPASDESLSLEFDTISVPYLGLWICQGGWPSPDRGHYTLALEPCSGRPDSLAEAIQRGESQALPAKGKKSWELKMSIQTGSLRPEQMSSR